MATALQRITFAMQEIGAIAIEELPTAAEAQKGLQKLQDMIETWNTEKLLIYTVEPQVFPVVANQQSYTMGLGGNFNVPRPVMIDQAFMRDANGNDYPMMMLDNISYSNIVVKSVASSIPTAFYDDGDFPLKTLRFWPVAADASFSFVLWTWKAIQSPPLLTTQIVLPPGYGRAFDYNLAIELCPSFGVTPSNILMKLATDSKAALKRLNYDVARLGFSNALVDRRSYGFYAVLTGQ